MKYNENRFQNVSLVHFLQINLPLFVNFVRKNIEKLWKKNETYTVDTLFSRNTGVAQQACNVELIKLLNRE